jgi:hypothetical protein
MSFTIPSSSPSGYWHCNVCNFEVFNSKNKCSKCLTIKPKPLLKTTTSSYVSDFDKETRDFFQEKFLDEKTNCAKCKLDGRKFKKDPMISLHNCWKYS